MGTNYKPLPGSTLFKALLDRNSIIMASNVRIVPGVLKGIFRAAKDTDSAVIFELARSECNLEGGYTGMTPADYAKVTMETAAEVKHDVWALHADHIGIKKGTQEEIADVKKLVKSQIDNGFTSFAIDASHLFNFEGGNLKEELRDNILASTEIGNFIKENMGDKSFGLEVEVGEIGRADSNGMVLTRPEEGVTFIKELNKNGIFPHVLATANGTAHGNVYDENGNLIEDISIDINQTKAVAKALKDNDFDVRIAQHGITGTPRDKIGAMFPKGDIIKGNVATFWQNLVFDTLKIYEPELHEKIWNWVIESYGNKEKKDVEVFGKKAKLACGQFFKELSNISDEAKEAIESLAYAEALLFFKAFNSYETAEVVRQFLKK